MEWHGFRPSILVIGVAKAQMSSSAVVVPVYSISISPSRIDVISGNGAASSPSANSTVNNGVGPFTYLWTITGSDISINSETSDSTTFSASGFNNSYQETATLTVTDSGNGDAETSKNIIVRFDFESGA